MAAVAKNAVFPNIPKKAVLSAKTLTAQPNLLDSYKLFN
jgi:hypothetical protein